MNTIRFESRDAFVAALEGRRSFWVKVDERLTREHAKAEAAWLVKARVTLKKALEADYATLRTMVGSRYSSALPLVKGEAPECPVLWVPKLESVLAALKLTQGKTFSVDSSGVWAQAHSLLTHDPFERRTAC